MSRISMLSNPLLLGFEEIERMIERAGNGEHSGYPPYNIERVVEGDTAAPSDPATEDGAQLLRITLAVAGFKRDELDITLEDNQLTIKGRQTDDETKHYIHRGIAARQFQKIFVIAEGIEVKSADLKDGILAIDLERLVPLRAKKRIAIGLDPQAAK